MLCKVLYIAKEEQRANKISGTEDRTAYTMHRCYSSLQVENLYEALYLLRVQRDRIRTTLHNQEANSIN